MPAPEGSTRPSGKLREMIASDFGGEQQLLDGLAKESVNHFASGWGWLILNNGKLEGDFAPRCRHAGRARHDAAPDHRCVGACLLHRLSQRPVRFVKSVLEKIINWDFVARNLDGEGAPRRPGTAGRAERARDYCLSR